MTTLPDNTHRFFLTTVILVLSALACSLPVQESPTTVPTTVPDNTQAEKPVLSGKPTTPLTTPETSVVTASQSLHVRAARGTDAIVIGYLYHGDTVTLTDSKCDQGWAEIVWDAPHGTGWVNARYLSKNKCSEEK